MPSREDCNIRPISESDLEQVLRWRNSERIRANMYTDHLISWEEHQAWFMKLKEDQTAVYLIFEFLQRPVGFTYFTCIDSKNGKCFFGFYLGEEKMPRGIGTIMGVLGIEHAFGKMGIRKLCGETFAFNKASINLFRRLGFAEEGHFVKHILKNEKYEDVISFAILKEDWENNRRKLEEIAFS